MNNNGHEIYVIELLVVYVWINETNVICCHSLHYTLFEYGNYFINNQWKKHDLYVNKKETFFYTKIVWYCRGPSQFASCGHCLNNDHGLSFKDWLETRWTLECTQNMEVYDMMCGFQLCWWFRCRWLVKRTLFLNVLKCRDFGIKSFQ